MRNEWSLTREKNILTGIFLTFFVVLLLTLYVLVFEKFHPSKQSLSPELQTNSNEISPLPTPQLFPVIRIVDGDTIVVQIDGKNETVRLIGINTPETVDPRRSVECFGTEASERMKVLLEGSNVQLEKDVSERDRYDRLLRYVYKDAVMINELLVSEGYAKASAYPPDVKYQSKFTAAETAARENKRGLWSDSACVIASSPTPSTKPSPKPSPSPAPSPTLSTAQPGPISSYTCDCSKTCAQLSCAEAQYQLSSCKCSQRDGDDDGTACDSHCQ